VWAQCCQRCPASSTSAELASADRTITILNPSDLNVFIDRFLLAPPGGYARKRNVRSVGVVRE